jgi:hypothetical protein
VIDELRQVGVGKPSAAIHRLLADHAVRSMECLLLFLRHARWAVTMSVLGVERKSSVRDQTDANNPNSAIDYYRPPALARIVVAPKATCGAPASDLLLHVSEEARRWQRADERLFGHRSSGTRPSGGDRGALACDLRRVLTLHYCAHVGSRGEAVDLHLCSDRLHYRPGQVGRIRNVHRQYQRVSTRFRGAARRFGRKLPSRRHFLSESTPFVSIVNNAFTFIWRGQAYDC